MLPKVRRLSSPEVKVVLARGRSRRATHLSMKYLASPTPLKTSVIVPKSLAKRAVERNRLRRAVYHTLAPYKGTGSAIIFVQKKPRESMSAVFTEDVEVLLRSIE